MTEPEVEVVADEGPCACDPGYHRVLQIRHNETRQIARRRYKCNFCLRRWTGYELTTAEMELMREKLTELTRLKRQLEPLLKLVAK